MSSSTLIRSIAIVTSLFACSAYAESSGEVLVRGPEAVLTRADWDADLTRIPATQRAAFATSPQRVQTNLTNLLVNRTLAERARALGVDKDPVVERRIALESDRVLAALMIERIEADAGTEFERATEKNLARARELYLVNRSTYTVPEEVEASHILFDTSKRGKDAALAAANDARAKLLAGEDIAVLAVAVSDDPSAARNKGRLGWNPRGRFDPAFEAAAFAMKNPGDISEPILTRFGYHVIRLESRKPEQQLTFDEVRDKILAELRQKFVNDARESAISAIRTDGRVQVNQEAVDALVVKVDVPPLTALPPKPVTPGAPSPVK